MELAGQWRREWAGTAEYGKVTEGGVTRRVARALEVLNASGPGARVRVMRAAYHSTSGPGVPASSYMLHSSRRVISSGFDLLESPTYPSKPLEISSTPLDSLPDSIAGTENYKVTEPDDTEISEPSKWRSAKSTNGSLRMPSEESSSTENASIIDLDSRFSHKGLNRKCSNDSENSHLSSFRRSSSRTSPLLDAPVTLSTLKYKSLLNNSNDWNNRRKSYSFEDTSPLNEIMLQSNDTLAMESSTDSGICKSSELVNDISDDTRRRDFSFERTRDNFNNTIKSSDEWHIRNRFRKNSAFKPYKDDYFVEEDPPESTIALQSRGKVSITVPITLEEDSYHMDNNQTSDDGERKVKRVGFCKTELHFAAESGKVNIIATDEKPPPTNDFRKRKSAFVPINERFEKPITLFGDKTESPDTRKVDEYGVRSLHECMESEENTAATKSILKNRIPKPKPYLLGENMVFGNSDSKELTDEYSTPLGVSLINKQLQTRRANVSEENITYNSTKSEKSFRDSLRKTDKDPPKLFSSTHGKYAQKEDNIPAKNELTNNSPRNKLKFLQMSPVLKPKTRQLRESDLTYFGIDNSHNRGNNTDASKSNDSSLKSNFVDDTFESVRLIKQVSSAQNSEAESDDAPDYQNIPMRSNFAPVPTPRSRVKYKTSDDRLTALKPIIERANETTNSSHETRRSRTRKQEVTLVPASRSLSEPVKKFSDMLQREGRRDSFNHQSNDRKQTEEYMLSKITDDVRNSSHIKVNDEDDVPLYANVMNDKIDLHPHSSEEAYNKTERRNSSPEYKKGGKPSKSDNDNMMRKENSMKKSSRENSMKKSSRQKRTEKLSTPEHTTHYKKTDSSLSKKIPKDSESVCRENNSLIRNSHKGTVSDYKENKSNSVRKHRERSSNRTETERRESKESAPNQSLTTVNPERKIRTNNRHVESPKRTSAPKKEKESSHKSVEPIVIEHATKSKDLRVVDQLGTDKNSLSNGRRSARRSEYVIKYDDKNGTVSSISKVRAGHGTNKQRHTSKETKNILRDSRTKNKNAEISTLRNAAPRSSQACERKK